jgi:hypothetical protein
MQVRSMLYCACVCSRLKNTIPFHPIYKQLSAMISQACCWYFFMNGSHSAKPNKKAAAHGPKARLAAAAKARCPHANGSVAEVRICVCRVALWVLGKGVNAV